LAPDLFAGDPAALGLFRNALYKEDKFAPEAFQNPQNFFAGRNVTVIVLEVPSQLIALYSEAAFAVAGFNGRGLADDVMDVMLALTTNTALLRRFCRRRDRG
jgi:hypothetical protein